MKKETKGNNIRLGIFVTVAVLLFIGAIYFLGQKQQLFSKTFHLVGVFKDIGGLQVGNNIRFSGINVGVVEDIEQISDSAVRVDMQIDESTRKFIKKDAQATIGSDGLMGNKILLIMPGAVSTQAVKDDDTIHTAPQVSMDQILANVKVTTDNTSKITADLSVVMNNIKEGKGTIGKLLMDSTMAENVGSAIVNIKQGAGGFKQNMDAASHNVLLRGYLKKKRKAAEKEKKEKSDQ
ncbi:MAG TPA: MlaD family protein [Cytophagaceae bacterium]|jgi:phospholipid/cholesterol/gamma-HCH transport system substrate-binding protein|nr:MlaD family protein [Cytophagaceae bacterium]